MSKTDFKTVDQYIAAQPEAMRIVLEHVRHTIHKALPAAEEVISYKMPAYRLHGAVVLYFAGWKHHYSIYPVGEQLVAMLGDMPASYTFSKGTIRFQLSARVPVKRIERIAKLRAKQTVVTRKREATRKPASRFAKAP